MLVTPEHDGTVWPVAAALAKDVLAEIVQTVLERAAFVFSEPRAERWCAGGQVWRAEVAFSCPQPGALAVASTPEFAAVLASNLLGIEPDDPAAERSAEDALREISNMVSGAVVDHCQNEGLRCTMGTPELRILDKAEHLESCEKAALLVSLLAEDHCLDVALLRR